MYKQHQNIDTEPKELLEVKINQVKLEIRELEKQKHDLEVVKDQSDVSLDKGINDTELKVWGEKVKICLKLITIFYRFVRNRS